MTGARLNRTLAAIDMIRQNSITVESGAGESEDIRSVVLDGFTFQVLRADSRKIHSLLVEKPAAAAEKPGTTPADR